MCEHWLPKEPAAWAAGSDEIDALSDHGSMSELQSFWNFESSTSGRAFLACRALHAPRHVALADFLRTLLGWPLDDG